MVRALPEGASRASSQSTWREAVRHSPALDLLREDRRATTLAVADVLAFTADWTTLTTRPTWALLGARTGRSRATVARALALLRSSGLLGIVATGRSAGYAPMALDGRAEAAVYVLAVPATLHLVADAGDEVETPTRVAGVFIPPRETIFGQKTSAEPLRGTPLEAAARPSVLAPHRNVPLWPSSEPARRKDDRLRAASELQRLSFPLRRTSTAWIAASTKAFMLAGWTITDILYAVDHLPNGNLWHHDGATGVKQLGRWLEYRLSPWRDEHGTVRLSPRQRSAAAATEARARALARAKAHEEFMADRAPSGSPAAIAARARIRATIELAQRKAREGTDG